MTDVFCCKECNVEKPRTEEHWHRDKNVPDGFCRKCKVCKNSYRDQWYRDNWQKCQENSAAWRKANRAQFDENMRQWAKRTAAERSAYKKQWREANIDRVLERNALHYHANKDRYRQNGNKWRAKNRDKHIAGADASRKRHLDRYRVHAAKRRAMKQNAPGTFTREDIKAQLIAQNGRCYWCSEAFVGDNHTIDHLTPLSRGGSNYPSNLVCACRSCNSQKGPKTPDEYRLYLKEFGK
ncbi:hypothetical protein EOD10_04405 [Mesorhizobium sp. M7A.T.Ca.TU.009.01.3.2]|nr:hypothetical protein EOD10_04405 [Mesorhizobium sp. M7A.T.Ca.TU.009.01.3.2]